MAEYMGGYEIQEECTKLNMHYFKYKRNVLWETGNPVEVKARQSYVLGVFRYVNMEVALACLRREGGT